MHVPSLEQCVPATIVVVRSSCGREAPTAPRDSGAAVRGRSTQVHGDKLVKPRPDSHGETMRARSAARLVLLDVCGIISAREPIPRFAATRGAIVSGTLPGSSTIRGPLRPLAPILARRMFVRLAISHYGGLAR